MSLNKFVTRDDTRCDVTNRMTPVRRTTREQVDLYIKVKIPINRKENAYLFYT